jgi:hypothetical protein
MSAADRVGPHRGCVAIFHGAEVLHVCHLHDGLDHFGKEDFSTLFPLEVWTMFNQQSLRYRLLRFDAAET